MQPLKIRTVPSTVNPTPRPSSSAGRPGTSGGRPGPTAGGRQHYDSNGDQSEFVDYEAEVAAAYGSLLTAEQIEEASGGMALENTVQLSLRIDTSKQSVSNIGNLLPNLRELCLDSSSIASIRDLGIALKRLKVLSMNDCAISELDGISALSSLEILLLKSNSISDISPLAMHDNLKELDLHGNRVCDISVVDTLSSCQQLRSLRLSRNVIERAPNYRAVICALIPHLTVLDGLPVEKNIRDGVTNAMILDASATMKVIREELEDEERLEMCILDSDSMNAQFNTFSSKSYQNFTEGSSSSLAAETSVGAIGSEPDTGSELTHGSSVVLAGGVAAAMRKRRANKLTSSQEINSQAVNSSEDPFSDESVSVLQTLDELAVHDHLAKTAKQRGVEAGATDTNNGKTSGFLFEGDLTVSLLGHQPRPGTSGGKRPTSSSSPRPSTIQRRGASDSAISRSGSRSPVNPSSPLLNTERRKIGKKLIDSNDVPESMTLPGVNESGHSIRPSSSGGRPPRSPLTGGPSPRAESPLQHNASRPGTTMTGGRPMSSSSQYSDEGIGNLSDLAMSAPSAPFKVSVPLAMRGEDLNILRSRLAPPSASCSEDEGDHDTVISGSSYSTRSSANKSREPSLRVSAARQTVSRADLLDLNEYDNELSSRKKTIDRSGATASSSAGQTNIAGQVKGIALLKNNSSGGSIVHRDVVRRRGRRSSDDWDEEDEDDEDILVDHATRHSLMTTRSRGGGTQQDRVSSPSTYRANRLGSDLMAQMNGTGKPSVAFGDTGTVSKENSKKMIDESAVDAKPMTKPPTVPSGGPTLSSIAGRSLGFDLSGSLAAIDKWVEDMDTGGSSDEDCNETGRNISSAIGVDVQSVSQGADDSQTLRGTGGSCGGQMPIESHRGSATEKSDTSSYGSRSHNSLNREILSRQRILSMCVGKEDDDESSIDNDILFIDVNNQSSKNPAKSFSERGKESTLVKASLRACRPSEEGPPSSRYSEGSQSNSSGNSKRLSTAALTNQVDSSNHSSDANEHLRYISRYEGAVVDNSYSIPSKDLEDVSSDDDDEGDLNDLYAENKRIMASAPTAVPGNKNLASISSFTRSPKVGSNSERPSLTPSKNGKSHLDTASAPKSRRDENSENVTEAASDTMVEKRPLPTPKGSLGDGVLMSDNELIELLNKPPKTTYALRTKSNFQEFFRGMKAERMEMLLEHAYAKEENDVKRREKVRKRMELLKEVLQL